MSINPHFQSFLDLPDDERRTVFEATAERLNTLPSYIEKDFWVCHVLDVLYNAETTSAPRLLFKGGTSLSKVYETIQRFSEDIDIVVFREDLGFVDENDPTNPDLGTKQRNRLIDAVNSKASTYIQNELSTSLQSDLPDCELTADATDEIGMTLFIEYQSLYQSASEAYVQPRIKLEGGARSAVEPHSTHNIAPYIQSELDDYEFSVPNVITIDAERTFLDKVIILHGWHCGNRDEQRLPADQHRLSRHYYDVATISTTSIGEQAIKNLELLNSVITHAQMFFRRGWMKLDEILTDSLKIAPKDDLYKALEKDYTAMQEMLFGDVPSFSSVIEHISLLEERLNAEIHN